jgi:hypothetical protein
MAMIKDRLQLYGEQLEEQRSRQQRLQARLSGGAGDAMDTDDLPSEPDAVQAALMQAEGEIARWGRCPLAACCCAVLLACWWTDRCTHALLSREQQHSAWYARTWHLVTQCHVRSIYQCR